MQSDQLLRGMHKVFSHDLPNQLVALQSLLLMLQQEEAARLSADGQEYVQRLQKVARRTSAMVRFLKEMGRLQSYAGKPETLSLSLLAREIQGTLKQQFPALQFAFDWQWTLPTITADYRTFLQALTEILTCLVSPQANAYTVHAVSQAEGNRSAIHFVLATPPPAKDNKPHVVLQRAGVAPLEQRMEIILAREWLAISEATLEVNDSSNGAARFTIFLGIRH